MSMNLVTLLYLLASVCFIQALKGLSHPTTARRGNAFGMTGMAIAAVTTIALIYKLKAEMFAGTESGASTGFILIFAGLVVGGGIGAYVARTVEMTKMPELVAAMHSLIGLAAVCIATAAVAEPSAFGITLPSTGTHSMPSFRKPSTSTSGLIPAGVAPLSLSPAPAASSSSSMWIRCVT